MHTTASKPVAEIAAARSLAKIRPNVWGGMSSSAPRGPISTNILCLVAIPGVHLAVRDSDGFICNRR